MASLRPIVSSTSHPPSAARGYLLIHVCVVLWGFTPIMGRLISLDALPLVWWRMWMASALLLLVPATWRGIRRLPLRLVAACIGVGCVLAATWALFYLAVKLTNASVAAICLSTAPLFVALGAPLVTRQRYRPANLLLALAIIPGIGLIVGGMPHGMYLGFAVGLLSTALLVVFTSLNKVLVTRIPPLGATCIELAAGAAFLGVLIALMPGATITLPGTRDLELLLVFAAALTSLPLVLMLVALRSITVFAQQMATNLEPVYAVLLAIPLLGEQQELSAAFYAGVALIVGTVMLEPALHRLRSGSPHGPAERA